jgi:hypothetical protein
MYQLILLEELSYAMTPFGFIEFSIMIGPGLAKYGSEELKNDLLPRMARGEIVICQPFTEPEAGSDAAAIQCSATLDGDYYVLNGQKTFITFATLADYAWFSVRTDPKVAKHKGISNILVDMKSEGVTVRPLMEMGGEESGLGEIFLDNVRVHRKYLIGELNQGWKQTLTSLEFERALSRGFLPMRCKRVLDDLLEYIKDKPELASNTTLRDKLAQMAIEIEVARLHVYYPLWMYTTGTNPGYEGSIAKVFCDDLAKKLINVVTEVLGSYSVLRKGSKLAPLDGETAQRYPQWVCLTVAGGTAEVNRNVIAMRGLGLPS